MKISDLYDKYDIMPQLRTHQLRVGGIVRLITKDKDAIITALLHDMGNLAKFKLVDNEWIQKQIIFRSKYGHDANAATYKILEETGLLKYEKYLREEGAFYDTILNRDSYIDVLLPAIFTLYADSRVAINGVTTLEDRITDLERRYEKHRDDRKWAYKLEEYVQSKTKTKIADIKESDVTPLFDELLGYAI